MAAYARLPPYPEVGESLLGLRRKAHRLYAFSNGAEQDVRLLLQQAALLDLTALARALAD